MRPVRRRRIHESGQGFWEWMAVGAAILAVGTAVTALTGGYLAATYDQHHSRTPLSAAAPEATPTPEPPSIVFVDPSPVGLNEACITRAAALKGLTWDGGELGWSAGSNPRPAHSDSDYDAKVRAWRARMTGLLAAAQASPDWQACLKPQLTPPPDRTQEPTEAVDPDGTYSVDPAGVQAIGGCGSEVPTSLTISGKGTAASVSLGSRGFSLQGTFNSSSGLIDVESHDPNGADRSLKGSIVSNAGVTRFTGNYDTHDLTAGCGYEFTAEKR